MELPPESSISVRRNYMNLGEAQRRYECVNDCGSLKQWSDRQVAVGILRLVLLVIVSPEVETTVESARLRRQLISTGRLSVDVDVISAVGH